MREKAASASFWWSLKASASWWSLKIALLELGPGRSCWPARCGPGAPEQGAVASPPAARRLKLSINHARWSRGAVEYQNILPRCPNYRPVAMMLVRITTAFTSAMSG